MLPQIERLIASITMSPHIDPLTANMDNVSLYITINSFHNNIT